MRLWTFKLYTHCLFFLFWNYICSRRIVIQDLRTDLWDVSNNSHDHQAVRYWITFSWHTMRILIQSYHIHICSFYKDTYRDIVGFGSKATYQEFTKRGSQCHAGCLYTLILYYLTMTINTTSYVYSLLPSEPSTSLLPDKECLPIEKAIILSRPNTLPSWSRNLSGLKT